MSTQNMVDTLSFDTILNLIDDPVFVKNSDLRFIYVNDALCELFGMDREKIIGKTLGESLSKDQMKSSLKVDREVLDSGKSNTSVESIIGKNGILLNIITKKTQYTDDRGNKFLVGVIHNSTNLKKSEEAFMKRKELYELTISAVNDGVWDWNVVTGEAFFSDAYYRNLGYKNNEFHANYTKWRTLVHPDDIERVERELQQGVVSDKGFDISLRMSTKQGKWVWVSTRGKAIEKDINGSAIRMVGTLTNITERKKMEELLRVSIEKFEKLTENVPGLIFQFTRRLDGTYFVPIASKGIKDIFGCSPKDVVNDFSPISKALFPGDLARVLNAIETSAKNMTHFTCEFRVQIPGKPIQWIYSNSRPEKFDDGTITWYGYNFNITDRKILEEKMATLKHTLDERYKELDCLYSISKIIESTGNNIDKILSEVVMIMPNAFQYPEITCAKIVYEGKEYKTENYRATEWKIGSAIQLEEKIIGSVDVCYLEEKALIDEGPFEKEEKNLIDAITERLGTAAGKINGEANLIESERDLNSAQEVAKVGSWKWNLAKKEVLWSDEMYRIFGIDKKTYKGRLGDAISSVIHPEDLHLVLPENAPSFSDKKPVEYRIILPDKSIRYISALAGESIKDVNGGIVFITGTAQDITEKKIADNALIDKVAELEIMNKLMINRELTMIELKKEVELLKSKLT